MISVRVNQTKVISKEVLSGRNAFYFYYTWVWSKLDDKVLNHFPAAKWNEYKSLVYITVLYPL